MIDKKQKNTSGIGYVGNVTIKVVGSKNKLKKQYKVKNKGYLPLFKYISYCLLGNNEPGLCPLYVTAYHMNSTSDENSFFTSSTHVVSSKPVVKTGISFDEYSENHVDYATAEFTFVISNAVLESNETINCLALYCSDYYQTFNKTSEKNPSAVVILDEDVTVASGENLVVVWDLVVSNNDLVLEEDE